MKAQKGSNRELFPLIIRVRWSRFMHQLLPFPKYLPAPSPVPLINGKHMRTLACGGQRKLRTRVVWEEINPLISPYNTCLYTYTNIRLHLPLGHQQILQTGAGRDEL